MSALLPNSDTAISGKDTQLMDAIDFFLVRYEQIHGY